METCTPQGLLQQYISSKGYINRMDLHNGSTENKDNPIKTMMSGYPNLEK